MCGNHTGSLVIIIFLSFNSVNPRFKSRIRLEPSTWIELKLNKFVALQLFMVGCCVCNRKPNSHVHVNYRNNNKGEYIILMRQFLFTSHEKKHRKRGCAECDPKVSSTHTVPSSDQLLPSIILECSPLPTNPPHWIRVLLSSNWTTTVIMFVFIG